VRIRLLGGFGDSVGLEMWKRGGAFGRLRTFKMLAISTGHLEHVAMALHQTRMYVLIQEHVLDFANLLWHCDSVGGSRNTSP